MPHIQVENRGLVEALEKRFHVTCFCGTRYIRSSAQAGGTLLAPVRIGEDSIPVRVHRGTGADYLQRTHLHWP